MRILPGMEYQHYRLNLRRVGEHVDKLTRLPIRLRPSQCALQHLPHSSEDPETRSCLRHLQEIWRSKDGR